MPRGVDALEWSWLTLTMLMTWLSLRNLVLKWQMRLTPSVISRREAWSQGGVRGDRDRTSGSNPIVPLGNEGLIKVVDHFRYLGAFCGADGTNVGELNSRVGMASAASRELDRVWRDRDINLDTKMKFSSARVLSTIMCACGCWTFAERDEAGLNAFDVHCRRWVWRVWSERVTGISIGYRTGRIRLAAVVGKGRRLRLFGHMRRMDMDRIPKKLYLWKPAHGKRRPGQPKTSASGHPERHQQNGLGLDCRRGREGADYVEV